MEGRRAYVEKISNGRLGYVHMQDMSAQALEKLYMDLDTENRSREGVVVDIRNNNGGFVNPYAIDVFARQGYLKFTPRGFATAGGRTVVGQRVAGEADRARHEHALVVRRRGFHGRLSRAAPGSRRRRADGGLDHLHLGRRLLDGTSTVRMPFERITDESGNDMEMHPRPVDVRVDHPMGESYTGHDSQLDAAVAALLQRVGKGVTAVGRTRP